MHGRPRRINALHEEDEIQAGCVRQRPGHTQARPHRTSTSAMLFARIACIRWVEDVVAVTKDGVENLTDFLPAQLDDIERLIQEEGIVQLRPSKE